MYNFEQNEISEINKILDNSLGLGPEKLLFYKKAIMKLIYTKSVELSSLESAMEIIESYKENGAPVFEVIELYVFLLECATHLLADLGQDLVGVDKDFYDALESIFDDISRQIKRDDYRLFIIYAIRLREIIDIAQDNVSRYGDHLSDIWCEVFGNLQD